MASRSRADIVRSAFGAYRTKDRKVLEDLLSDDFRFTSPYDDRINKSAYFERCWPNSTRIRGHEIETILEQGDTAFVTYLCTTIEGKQFRNTESFRFEGDKIKEVNVYFGASYENGRFVPLKT
jgi:ketosteroid isomerase-like protein